MQRWLAALMLGASMTRAVAFEPTAAESPPYERVDVVFESEGLRLAGSLLLPPGDDLPGLMMIQGSGASDRSNRWAYSIADWFARRGVAVLIPDKRGSGESQGDWRNADFEQLAADARAGWRLLRARPEVDATRVGYLGLSQGGHVAPLAAATSKGAAFVIDMVGSTRIMEDQLYDELESAYREHGLDQSTIEYLQEFARFSFDYIGTGEGWERYIGRHREISAGPLAQAAATWPTTQDDPYWILWRRIHDFDPIPWWQCVVGKDIPALIVYGADDRNVNVAASTARLRERIQEQAVMLRVYEGTGHSLSDPQTHELRADVFTETLNWLLTRTNLPPLR